MSTKVESSDVQPIPYVSFTSECYHRIKRDILNARIDWGERLDVVRLAEKYGVSRSPVVKAIERLAHEGLVEILPNKGSYVHVPTEEDVIEVTEVRIALELTACELAYTKHRDDLLRDLEENENRITGYKGQDQLIPFGVFLDYDHNFHRIFALLSDNRRLLEIFDVNRSQIELFRTKTYAPDKAAQAIKMHHRVIEELHSDRLMDAVQILRQHIEEVCRESIESLRLSKEQSS